MTAASMGKLNLHAGLRGLIVFLTQRTQHQGRRRAAKSWSADKRVGFLSRDEASRTIHVATITRDVDRLVAAYQVEIEQL